MAEAAKTELLTLQKEHASEVTNAADAAVAAERAHSHAAAAVAALKASDHEKHLIARIAAQRLVTKAVACHVDSHRRLFHQHTENLHRHHRDATAHLIGQVSESQELLQDGERARGELEARISRLQGKLAETQAFLAESEAHVEDGHRLHKEAETRLHEEITQQDALILSEGQALAETRAQMLTLKSALADERERVQKSELDRENLEAKIGDLQLAGDFRIQEANESLQECETRLRQSLSERDIFYREEQQAYAKLQGRLQASESAAHDDALLSETKESDRKALEDRLREATEAASCLRAKLAASEEASGTLEHKLETTIEKCRYWKSEYEKFYAESQKEPARQPGMWEQFWSSTVCVREKPPCAPGTAGNPTRHVAFADNGSTPPNGTSEVVSDDGGYGLPEPPASVVEHSKRDGLLGPASSQPLRSD
eukprot:gnl/TRDRNA2_/TRDRNA2_127232_c2_seq1.p1 gnl/TRDRNA2_/TRDRNA2_127232_c2~~gnl/TRDRNA2_/TRDRNA2_127232_c2_seq1.p1  ORF type:complete len:503 (+),score=107.97 gnl/TRDRNA2_/TRDRNA2_127232_c2_seq1:224-1510(+)